MGKYKSIDRNTVFISFLWKILERLSVQGVQFFIQIILARLLTPSDYGLLALIIIFIQIANAFVQSGFSTALIQKHDTDEADFSSVFYLSLAVAALFYAVLFFTAPFIASFYKETKLISVIRILSITLFFGALNSVQTAFVTRKMQFKKIFFSSLIASVFSGILGIVFAYNNYGVWALVAQQLSNIILVSFILLLITEWKPKICFSITKLKKLFSFGKNLLCSGLLEIIYRNVYTLIVGKIYDTAMVGVFTRGPQFPEVVASTIDTSIQTVMLPTLSSKNDDKEFVKQSLRRSMGVSAFIMMPLMFGLIASAEPLVRILLSNKWLGCVPFLRLACIRCALLPIHTANLTAINAMGRSDIFFKLEIIKRGIMTLFLFITIPLGVYYMAFGQVLIAVISLLINAYPNKNLLNYSYAEQIKDLLPSILLSLFMCACVYVIQFLQFSDILILLLQVFVGCGIYIGVSGILKLTSFNYIISTLRRGKNAENR